MDRARSGLTVFVGRSSSSRSAGGRRRQLPSISMVAAAVGVAAVDARPERGPDGWSLGVGRVRRDREPGTGSRGPRRPRGGVRDVLGLDRDAQGDLGGVDAARARPAGAARERRGVVRVARRRDLHGRVRRDRRRAGAAGRRRRRDRCGRLGRCDERVRRGDRGRGAAGRIEPRAGARRGRRERLGHERQRPRLVRPGRAVAAGSECAVRSRVPRRRPARRRRPRRRSSRHRPPRRRSSPRHPRPRPRP